MSSYTTSTLKSCLDDFVTSAHPVSTKLGRAFRIKRSTGGTVEGLQGDTQQSKTTLGPRLEDDRHLFSIFCSLKGIKPGDGTRDAPYSRMVISFTSTA